ncbi:uncharacterized protein LOC115621496 [Scaptodrosophila lebanonensis]|uniref:Uncharacterized protein LOC115621496 n=1 Tax=Drosophila lebanonensis TaxID=7225 RepID=A0A6J2T4S7_DROLE|nr:uncharacterized protein LOC115621496 [Scaptodrosophila lebanonensis]
MANLQLLLLLLLGLHCASGMWVKKYEENYHRPTYYNRAHKSSKHVNYNREELEQRDVKIKKRGLEPFDPNVHKSFYVHILYKGSVICAGALISRRMIITSSRCFLPTESDPTYAFKARYMTVRTGLEIGSAISTKPSQVIAFYMPATKTNMTTHDIALVALEKKLPKQKYRFIGLYRQIPKPGDSVQMAFLDPAEYEITLFPSKVVDMELCKNFYESLRPHNMPFGSEFFCTSNKPNNGKVACSTRPGDPLIINNELAAINIYGEHCDLAEGRQTMDVYYGIRHTIKYVQIATDLLRAFTDTWPFNDTKDGPMFDNQFTATP